MDWRKGTVWFILVVIIAIGIWDGLVLFQDGTEATISYTLRVWSKEYPAFTFAMGFTMGHLFWGMRKTPKSVKMEKDIQKLKRENRRLEKELKNYRDA